MERARGRGRCDCEAELPRRVLGALVAAWPADGGGGAASRRREGVLLAYEAVANALSLEHIERLADDDDADDDDAAGDAAPPAAEGGDADDAAQLRRCSVLELCLEWRAAAPDDAAAADAAAPPPPPGGLAVSALPPPPPPRASSPPPPLLSLLGAVASHVDVALQLDPKDHFEARRITFHHIYITFTFGPLRGASHFIAFTLHLPSDHVEARRAPLVCLFSCPPGVPRRASPACDVAVRTPRAPRAAHAPPSRRAGTRSAVVALVLCTPSSPSSS